MTKHHEVEYRALITVETFNNILKYGKKRFATTFKGPVEIEDDYFCPRDVKSFAEVEMNKIGSYSLRLRREIKEGVQTVSLNIKIIRNKGDHNAWLEHEIDLSSYDEGARILEGIGFKRFFGLRKKRFSFQEGVIRVCLEDIQDFQPAIELEVMSSESETSRAKKTILDYMMKNGIGKESIVEKSITNILMKTRSIF